MFNYKILPKPQKIKYGHIYDRKISQNFDFWHNDGFSKQTVFLGKIFFFFGKKFVFFFGKKFTPHFGLKKWKLYQNLIPSITTWQIYIKWKLQVHWSSGFGESSFTDSENSV